MPRRARRTPIIPIGAIVLCSWSIVGCGQAETGSIDLKGTELGIESEIKPAKSPASDPPAAKRR